MTVVPAKERNMGVKAEAPTTRLERPCAFVWMQVNVDYRGTVRPCCHVNDAGAFGNLNERSLMEIWNGEAWQRLRRAWVAGDLSGTPCEGCKVVAVEGAPIAWEFPVRSGSENSPASANQALALAEMQSGAIVQLAKPVVLQYFPSTLCNIDCTFCFQWDQKGIKLGAKGMEMVTQLMPTLMRIDWIGGEPTVQQDFRRWLSDLDIDANPNLNVGMVSNGTILDTALVKLFERISGFVSVSLDAVDKALYEDIRAGAVWEDTRRNVETYRAISRSNPGFRLYVSCLLQKKNLAHLPDFLSFCLEREIPAKVYPSESFPLFERLDMFDDPASELPENWEEVFERTLVLARALDAVQPNNCESTVHYCRAAVMRGLERHRDSRRVRLSPSPGSTGRMVVAYAAGAAIAYARVSGGEDMSIALPNTLPTASVRFYLHGDDRGTDRAPPLQPLAEEG
ncbi:SPASM domain-containing protein [Magnetospirillum gryphiswaldense]|nr:SPASM domain-containing protein [Magnetospirillum gryphiswaldense]